MKHNLAPLQNLIDQFERMQGIGHKSAQRMAYYVLGLSDEEANAFAAAITDAHTKIKQCKICCLTLQMMIYALSVKMKNRIKAKSALLKIPVMLWR